MAIIITLLLLSLFFCGNAMAQIENMPLIENDENYKSYYKENFKENDTTFIYRSYTYLKKEPKSDINPMIEYYYIIPHNHPKFLESVESVSSKKMYSSKSKFNETIADLKNFFPVFSKQDLGDIPRIWYPLVKYKGSYYFSGDEPWTTELTDSVYMDYNQELLIYPIFNFKKNDGGGWSFDTTNYSYDKETHISIVPCKNLKGTYIVTKTVKGEDPIKSLETTDRDIKNFDIIGFFSNEHLPEGLDYEDIDYEALMK